MNSLFHTEVKTKMIFTDLLSLFHGAPKVILSILLISEEIRVYDGY